MKICHHLDCWVGSLLSLTLLLVSAAVTNTVDAKTCFAVVGIFGQFQWPHGLRRRSAGCSPVEIVVSNPTGGHGCFSVVSVVCGQVEVSGTSRSLVQRSPTD